MPGLREIKRRIKSVKNTEQITKAMKMVSAAKLRKAQDDIIAARPYSEKMNELVTSLASKASDESHPFLSGEGGPNVGLILVTSDRGLCGSFNTVLLRTAELFVEERPEAKISLSLVGKRAGEYFKRRGADMIDSRPAGSVRPGYDTAVEIANKMSDLFLKEELDEVHIIYSKFISALTQEPVVQKLLPVTAEKEEGKEGQEGEEELGREIDILYEPSAGEVLASLLPKYIEVQIFRALLESAASEHGARMTAMDSASRNAGDMIGSLTLRYNRLRQAAITKELMEIISGSEALKA
ncbi:MAG: ATP synthase F1 subunit gamma [Thermodesulfobacteriota bacterium]